MAKFGDQYVGRVPWLLRAVLGSALIALILGAIVGAVMHRSPFWKIDGIIFAVLMGIEIAFRFFQKGSE